MARVLARLARVRPRQWLLGGWITFLLYAWPGFMSFDSVYQLQESRTGWFSDGHPPMMAQLWRIVELFVAGPAGMLLLQTSAFLVGVYLLFRRRMSDRAAAIATIALLWFPPVGNLFAVIWKDSQMTAYITLGIALILDERRGRKLLGLALIALGTGMRHNALVMTLPLVVVLFQWNTAHGFWKRHAIAFVAWIAVTMSARVVSNALTDEHRHIYAHSLQLCDMATTLRMVEPPLSDEQLREILDGSTLMVKTNINAQIHFDDPRGTFVDNIWWNTYKLFAIPKTDAQREGNARAWKRVLMTYKAEYIQYRWEIFSRVLGIGGDGASPFYTWFVDVQTPLYTHIRIHHDASASGFTEVMRELVHAVGRSPVTRIMLYLILAFLLVPFSLRDREALAWLLSAFANEAFLVVFSPTTDWRYSYWLVLAVSLSTVLLVARRASRRKTLPQTSPT